MKVNGDSIYGTTASPLKMQAPWGCVTQKGNMLYLHVFALPEGGQLLVPMQNGVESAYLLADPNRAALKLTSLDIGTEIAVPEQSIDPIDTVIALKINNPSAML